MKKFMMIAIMLFAFASNSFAQLKRPDIKVPPPRHHPKVKHDPLNLKKHPGRHIHNRFCKHRRHALKKNR